MTGQVKIVTGDAGGNDLPGRGSVTRVALAAFVDVRNRNVAADARLGDRMAIRAFVGAMLVVVEARPRHPRVRNANRSNVPRDRCVCFPWHRGPGDLVTHDTNAYLDQVLRDLLCLGLRPSECALPLLVGYDSGRK